MRRSVWTLAFGALLGVAALTSWTATAQSADRARSAVMEYAVMEYAVMEYAVMEYAAASCGATQHGEVGMAAMATAAMVTADTALDIPRTVTDRDITGTVTLAPVITMATTPQRPALISALAPLAWVSAPTVPESA